MKQQGLAFILALLAVWLKEGKMEIIIQFILLLLGFKLLDKGADWFVKGAAGLASKFGISQLVIGLTVVAMGTSAPEAAVSIAAAFQGSADITIGNILGSNIMNILVILGCTAAITPLIVRSSTTRVELPFVIGISLLLLYQGKDGSVSRMDGIVLTFFFIIYLAYAYYMAKKEKEIETLSDKQLSLVRCLAYMFIGLVVLIVGSKLTVFSASAIALYAGLSERFIGLTVVAFGTSLPELFTCVTAARTGNADIAIGNIVGSNIFNILFVVGLSALIIDIPFAVAFAFDSYVAVATAFLLWLLVLPKNSLPRWAGIVLLFSYAVYFIHIL